jgi:predicted HD superfamily hydrolase involved in NAD metabolism
MDAAKKTRERLLHKANERLYGHCLRTAETARDLALRFGADPVKAYLAGLLHDCAKALTSDEILQIAYKSGLALSAAQISDPYSMLHGQVGSIIASGDYGVDDSEVLQAIARHQCCAVDMKLLDSIVKLADIIEPQRKGDKFVKTRELAIISIESAMLYWMQRSFPEFIEEGLFLEPGMVEYYNQLLHQQKTTNHQIIE